MRDDARVTDPFAVPAGTPPVAEPPAFGEPLPVTRRNGMGTAALILGIASIPLCGLVVLGPLAIVFGIVGRKRVARRQADNKSAAVWGMVLGLFGALLSTVVIVALVHFVRTPEFDRFMDCDKGATTTEAQNQCAQDLVDELFDR
jgi:hypothetical protein